MRSLLRSGVFCLAWTVVVVAPPSPLFGQLPSTSFTLRQLLDSVSARHPMLAAADARVRAARGSRTTAGAFGNPMLAYQIENARLPGGTAPPMDRETMLMATLPLHSVYQRGSLHRRADAEFAAAEADASGARQRIALEAARAFYHLALAQVKLDIARDLASWLDTLAGYTRAQVGEGVAAESDLIRTELERDRATLEVAMESADLARARASLAAFFGSGVTGVLARVGDEPFPMPVSRTSTADSSSEHTVQLALARRPDIMGARERVAAAGAGVSSEWTMLFRDLGATVGTKRAAGSTSLIAGVSLALPLFDQNRGEIARARAERDAAVFELEDRERVARAEVTGEYEAAALLTDRMNAFSRDSAGSPNYLDRADEARRIALGAYREGAVPVVQVIDAARARGEARVAYYETLFAQHQSVLTFTVAQGGDLAQVIAGPDPLGFSAARRELPSR